MKPIETALLTVGVLAMGYYFGLQTAGRLGYRGAASRAPEWVATVQTISQVTLVVLVVALLGAVALYRWRLKQLGEWEADTE